MAVNVNVSALNERSVVIGTLSSPTFTPFTVSENQLSAHTFAVNVTDSATDEVSAVDTTGALDDEVAAAAVEVVSDDDDPPHPISNIAMATVPTMAVLDIIKALSQALERMGGTRSSERRINLLGERQGNTPSWRVPTYCNVETRSPPVAER